MGNGQTGTRIFTLDEVAAMQVAFQHMVEGQGVALYIADPGTVSRRATVTALERAGFEEIHEAATFDEILKAVAAATAPSTAVLADEACARRGTMDCLEFLRRFRRLRPQGVAVLTHSRLPVETLARARESGAEVFRRPLPLPEIISRLAALGIKAG